jgi:hypothetical protein
MKGDDMVSVGLPEKAIPQLKVSPKSCRKSKFDRMKTGSA